MFTSISRFCGAEVVTTFVSICQASSDSSHADYLRRRRPGGFNVIYTRPGRGTRAPRGTPGYARNNERNKPRAIVPGRLYHVRVRASARGHSGNGGPSPRAVPRPNRKAGRTGSRTRPGGLGETARSRVPRVWGVACGDGVTPHCTYGGTARRARRDLLWLCAPCGLFDIPTASVVPPHGSTHAMTLRTARGARARRPHARETDRRDGCGAFRRSP